jgi:AraC family transcriptional regulator
MQRRHIVSSFEFLGPVRALLGGHCGQVLSAQVPRMLGVRLASVQHSAEVQAHVSTARSVLSFGSFFGRMQHQHAAPGLEFSVLNADPDRRIETHMHEEAHFVLVLDGLYVSSAEGAEAISCGPFLVFNPAGTTHRDRFEARDRRIDGRFLTVSVTAELLATAGQHTIAVATVLDDRRALALATQLASACESLSTLAGLDRESIGFELLHFVQQRPTDTATSPPGWLSRATELLRDLPATDTNIRDVAAAAGVHPVHLARVFRKHVGCSPAEFVRRRRLERAESLLRYSTRPLVDIALDCGFVDQAHLTNVFRAQRGSTPAEFRRVLGVGHHEILRLGAPPLAQDDNAAVILSGAPRSGARSKDRSG